MHRPAAPSPAPERPAAATVRRVLEAVLGLDHPLEARPSPDGRRVAVTVSGPGGTHVQLVDPDGREAGGTLAGHLPRWLPDSRTLLLVTEPGPGPGTAAALPALTLWDTVDGRTTRLTSIPGETEDLLVADDGTEVLLLVADDGAERDGMHLGLPVRLGQDPAPESFRPDAGRRRLLHGTLPEHQATVVLREAGPPGLTVWNVAWRGGADAIATVSAENLPSGYYRGRLVHIDLTDGRTRTLYTPQGQLAAPALAPDGRRAVVVEGVSIVAGRPVLIDLADGTVTRPTAAEDATWLLPDPHDPDRLLLAGWAGTGSRIARVRLDREADGGAEVTTVWQDQAVLGGPSFQPAPALSADGSLAAAVLDAPGRPPQAVVAATAGPDAWAWRPVTALNPDTVARAALAPVRTRETSWTSTDGRPVHGLLLDAPGTPAPGTDRPGPRPLAVLAHGGPSWQWSAGHAPGDVLGLAPALAAAGWLVLLPNVRGSSGYGLDHARAVVGDFGHGDLDDLLTGVTAAVERGEAAPGRAAVLGHSYGGYLTAEAARTGAFRAAVVVSAPTDWLSFAHTSNIGGGYEHTYGIGDARTPEGRAALVDRSPVFRPAPGTPVLVLHGERDRVTPVSQAHELYRAWSRGGTAPVELHVYPGEGHEFTDPAHLLDAAARAEAWLARHVLGERAAHPAKDQTP
ncbi:prolyl oligopeptidase family serine peptidase [Streptomyces sp. NPDC059639]|uniref:S9 family peptidase n=1 Tax=Streptomyces sp. NPDC059639 TaxID=3346891 RepID=UPI0036B00C21